MSRRTIAGVLGGLTVFGTVFASAASLGGISPNGQVGADSASVTSCDSDGVGTSYTTAWNATANRYDVTSVKVSSVNNNCDGKTVSVSLFDTAGTATGSGSLLIPSDALATEVTVSLSPAISAKLVENVHVAIA